MLTGGKRKLLPCERFAGVYYFMTNDVVIEVPEELKGIVFINETQNLGNYVAVFEKAEMPRCPYCGSAHHVGVKKCKYCGASL